MGEGGRLLESQSHEKSFLLIQESHLGTHQLSHRFVAGISVARWIAASDDMPTLILIAQQRVGQAIDLEHVHVYSHLLHVEL